MPNKYEVEQSFQVPEEIPLPKQPETQPKKPEVEKPVQEAEKEYQKVDDDKPKKSIYVKKTAPVQPVQQEVEEKSEVYRELEEMLAKGLDQVYLSLDAKEQAEFRRRGEETASKIEELVVTFKAKAKDVLKLIKAWLLVIPKVNKHFLEQESKLRTDKVMAVAKQYKKENKR